MRSRSNSGVKLDNYVHIIQKSILKFQDPVSGLFSASKDAPHAWVRDNLYSIQAVWGLALAYRKHADLDEDKAKTHELEQSVVKCMRSLLQCMVRQADKLERFKNSQSPRDALHAKYDRRTCGVVVGDGEWGHLQLDATGFYVLMLAQMTASGYSIIYTLDEVAFVQNLVFYISSAYRTPDYGIWERGDKTNHGVPELNASSVGMCKAALEAIDELNLFGPSGGPQSVIHVTPDEKAMCQAILQSMLPRESNSKEVDAGLLSIIGYPAFAVNDQELVDATKEAIVSKLQGRYGCRRFLRDGYKTALEDSSRLHYELAELKMFEDIECEWPVFWTYLILDGIFHNNKQQEVEYREALEEILVVEDGIRCVPELYTVPAEKVGLEKSDPHSQDRIALGKLPHLWGHSLYILGRLMRDGYLAPGEIDPLNRRFATVAKPDVVVQVAIMAEETEYQEILEKKLGVKVETYSDLDSIRVQPSKLLSRVYSCLGRCPKLGLTGRPSSNQIGILGTSKLYAIRDQIFSFPPALLDQRDFYMSLDTDMLIDMFLTELHYLASNWNMLGRPIITVPIHRGMLAEDGVSFKPSLISTLRKVQSGYLYGVRVVLGTLESFLSTSCLTRLTFLDTPGNEETDVMRLLAATPPPRVHLLSVHSDATLWQKALPSPNEDKQHMMFEARLQGRRESGRRDSNDLTNVAIFNSIADDIKNRTESILKQNDPNLDPEDLIQKLKESHSLSEQVNILQCLYILKGPDYDTEINGNTGALVRDLIEELYEKAGQLKNWMVIRKTTGMLRKRVNGLSQAITDLLVRQKQVTVGLPEEPKEITITRPMPTEELYRLILEAFGEDSDIGVLTQELIMYLAMFMRTSPSLFNDLLRLRVGLIIQVMASELARHLRCGGEEVTLHLMGLSPFEMKTLIHNILSGKEFGVIKSVRSATAINHELSMHSEKSRMDKANFISIKKRLRQKTDLSGSTNSPAWSVSSLKSHLPDSNTNQNSGQESTHNFEEADPYTQIYTEKKGQWLRRRRIDGALNRVPVNFYTRIWNLLEKCYGLVIAGHFIPGYVTKEMTPGELKFALLVENVLNHIPQPEYRQLMVETLSVLTLLGDAPGVQFLADNLNVDHVLKCASGLFINDEAYHGTGLDLLEKDPTNQICTEFYDIAPSGPYGTMSYISKSVATTFQPYFPENVGDCSVS